MRWAWLVPAAFIAAGLFVWFVGSRLPREHAANGERLLPAPPGAVWGVLTDVNAFPTWRGSVQRVEQLPDRDGRPAWVEHNKRRSLTLVTERSEPPRVLTLRIAGADAPFGGTWTYTVEPVPGGSRLTITESGEIDNPLFRFMMRYAFGYDASIREYLSSIERHMTRGAPASSR